MLIKAQKFFCFVLFLPGLYYSFIIILSLVLNTDIFNTSVKPVSLQLLRIYFWDKYSPAKMTHSSNVNYHFLNESYVNFFTFKIFKKILLHFTIDNSFTGLNQILGQSKLFCQVVKLFFNSQGRVLNCVELIRISNRQLYSLAFFICVSTYWTVGM